MSEFLRACGTSNCPLHGAHTSGQSMHEKYLMCDMLCSITTIAMLCGCFASMFQVCFGMLFTIAILSTVSQPVHGIVGMESGNSKTHSPEGRFW